VQAFKLNGDETWQGSLQAARSLSGSWTRPDGVNGNFTPTHK